MIVVYWALTALMVVLVLRAVLSWFPPGGPLLAQVNSVCFSATEWLLAPVRRVVPPLRLGGAMLDMSFLVVFLVIVILRSFVASTI